MEKVEMVEKENVKKVAIWISVFVAGFFVKSFLGDSRLSDFLDANFLGIVAVIISPIIAVYVGETIQRNNYQRKREDKLITDLITYRNQASSSGFLGALNSIVLVFHENSKIKELVKSLHRAMMNSANQEVIDQMVVELIYEICKYKGYGVTENEIRNSFTINT
ncbi:DUF6680 family protein [Patescibacteria group bacterium]